ncbi:ABC transporter ATP-binding protein [Streptomyces prunicolor]|uniref:ABC transporter ATP-binding protein n=1 Tax=Streptomyces prunicolor TaxID=67348 RepID=A0ABU4F9V0_9ACTN|nr:ABC transporter ATP-binding protein [Streptomyces prunicolor]MDV7216803.1 ABC transporter ATP-binding protein [Streptomyces prunicolor]
MSNRTGHGGPADESAIEAHGVGMKYRRGWALRDCSFRLPAGRICGLVGPNGAGKTTLMAIAANLLEPATGTLRVFGAAPESAEASRRTAFLAQEKPLFRRFTVAETLRLGRELNPGWDQKAAENIVRAGNVPFEAKIGTLSGGQRTRVAFAVAFGKRPDLLLLDEPMSDLDPLVRHELMGTLLAEAAEHGTTVLMSTHMLTELENICDYLLVIANGGLRMAGEVDELLTAHALLTGIQSDGQPPPDLARHTVVETRTSGRQFTALIRPDGPIRGPWQADTPNLEELLLAYLRSPEAPPLISPSSQVGPRAVAA